MERDHGWIHTLLGEAENERMHLLFAMNLKEPTKFFRLAVLGAQGIWYNFFFVSYVLSPKFCHRMVGYLEEEAVVTYTKCIKEIDDPSSNIHHWASQPAPDIAKEYWYLGEKATIRDVVLVIRADEAHHRDVNHTLGDIDAHDTNPFSLQQ